jgi:hypothetical protein
VYDLRTGPMSSDFDAILIGGGLAGEQGAGAAGI